MLSPRVMTGAIYALAWIVLALLGGWALTIAVAALSLVALVELRWVASRRRVRLAVEVGYPICIMFVVAAHVFANDPDNYGLMVLGLILLAMLFDFGLHLGADLRSPTAGLSLTLFACIYCGLLPSAIVAVRDFHPEMTMRLAYMHWPLGERLLFFLLGVTMLSDVAGLVCGKLLGSRRFEGTVSPNKTYEGLAGAVVVAVLASLVFGSVFGIGPTGAEAGRTAIGHRVLLGLLLGVFGQLGDFGASIFKREAEVKNYGEWLPGHGGVLDRIDSLIVNAPLLYLYVRLAM